MAILKIRDAEGNVQEIPCIKGDKGDKGDAPIKGEDYMTSEDISSIVEQVLNALPIAENTDFPIEEV